jgi:hypothetical protein
MDALRSERTVLTAQGGYYVLTGLAPFASRRAFERVTGPKREWWLVQTVGVLVTAVGAELLLGVRSDRVTPELRGLAVGCAAGLMGIDVVYVAKGRIAPTYLLDAAAQAGALASLAFTAHAAARGRARLRGATRSALRWRRRAA